MEMIKRALAYGKAESPHWFTFTVFMRDCTRHEGAPAEVYTADCFQLMPAVFIRPSDISAIEVHTGE